MDTFEDYYDEGKDPLYCYHRWSNKNDCPDCRIESLTAEVTSLKNQLADHLRTITTCSKCGLRWVEPDGVEPPCPRCDNKWQQPVTRYSHFAYGAGGGSSGLPHGVGGPEPHRTVSTPMRDSCSCKPKEVDDE